MRRCLSGVHLSELEETYRREHPGKSRDRLQAAVLRKQDQERSYGHSITICLVACQS